MADETAKRWHPDAGTVIGVLALVFSIYSIVITNRQHADSEGTALINETYATYQSINARRMDTIEVDHLICGADDYPRVVALVREATSSLTPAERAQARLREGAMAMYLFSQFEQTLYLHRNAVEMDEEQRIAFSQGTLDYFTDVLLRNPRLVYLWSPAGANLRSHYDPIAQQYWDAKVASRRPRMDAVGPFGPT